MRLSRLNIGLGVAALIAASSFCVFEAPVRAKASAPAYQRPTKLRASLFSRELNDVQIPERCELGLKSQEFGYVIIRRKELQEDAFVDAFDLFIGDLQKLEDEGAELADAIASYERSECNPHNERGRQLEAEISAFKAQCGGSLSPEQYAACTSRKGILEERHRVFNNEYQRLHQKELSFAKRIADFDSRAANARSNAERVLDFDNTEQVLRLYVWKLRRQRQASGTPTSCESFARILEVMGKRVKNQDLLIDYVSRSLIEERLDLNFFSGDPRLRPLAGRTFNASGFRRQYYADITENQVRHVLGFIAAGYYRLGTPAKVVSFFADYVADTEEDYDLAVEGAKLGVGLKGGKYNSANFGRAVRGALCQ
jgi:hypothetical protein